jgi:AmmeMemoRadiSam system protein B
MSRREQACLRPLRAQPVARDGRELVLLHDPLGIASARNGSSGAGLFVPRDVWSIALQFDGQRTFDEIAAEASKRTGKQCSVAEVREIARALSHRFLLSDARSEAELAVQHAFFKSSPERPCVGAGRDYTADPVDLRIEIGGLVANDWDMPAPSGVFGVITPAASFRRAAKLYARTYAALRHCGGSFARVLVLGQMREPLRSPLVPLEKPFATPLGTLACDVDGVRALEIAPGPDELAHRGALVLERQCLFLKLLFPRSPIVPVLAAALPDPIEPSSPIVEAAVEAAVEALERVCALPGNTLVVCASDLSSSSSMIASADAPALRDRRERDRIAVEHATRADAEAFWREVVTGEDPSRASALSATYLFLRLCAGRSSNDPERGSIAGSVLGYEQLAPPGELTTAASVLFH